jgi:Holliday junction resolvase-like predicted endonuclease
MALLDEQLVEEWLNRKNFFTIRGIKCGIDEIDLLAVKHGEVANECWHVEVQVSFRPIGYIGGDTNARRRNVDEIRAGVEQWVDKKFQVNAK